MRVNVVSLYELRIDPRALNFGLGRYPIDSSGQTARSRSDAAASNSLSIFVSTRRRDSVTPGRIDTAGIGSKDAVRSSRLIDCPHSDSWSSLTRTTPVWAGG